MYGHHHHHHHHHGRRGGGHPFAGRGQEGRGQEGHQGRGGRTGRIFGRGDLGLVVLKLVADKPSHGYELIQTLEATAGGVRAPGPGVIYPTLTLLEELGQVTATAVEGKTLYTITDEGRAVLAEKAEIVDGFFARLAQVAQRGAVFSPDLLRARHALKSAVRGKLSTATPEQASAIAKALDDAAAAIAAL